MSQNMWWLPIPEITTRLTRDRSSLHKLPLHIKRSDRYTHAPTNIFHKTSEREVATNRFIKTFESGS